MSGIFLFGRQDITHQAIPQLGLLVIRR